MGRLEPLDLKINDPTETRSGWCFKEKPELLQEAGGVRARNLLNETLTKIEYHVD